MQAPDSIGPGPAQPFEPPPVKEQHLGLKIGGCLAAMFILAGAGYLLISRTVNNASNFNLMAKQTEAKTNLTGLFTLLLHPHGRRQPR
jgi:hypothetical protein